MKESEPTSEKVILVTRHIPLVKHVCPVCGAEFTGPRWRKYDRPECVGRAYYQRHADQRRAARMHRYFKSKGIKVQATTDRKEQK